MHLILLTDVIVGFGVAENAFCHDVGPGWDLWWPLRFDNNWHGACVLRRVVRILRIIHIRFDCPLATLLFLHYSLANMLYWRGIDTWDHTNGLVALLLFYR